LFCTYVDIFKIPLLYIYFSENRSSSRFTEGGYEKPPTRKIVLGGSPTLSQKLMVLWESVLKRTHLGQSCPTFAIYRFYEGAFLADSYGSLIYVLIFAVNASNNRRGILV
jgi:hypothetical protein